jgi:hypothetical protein
MTEIPDPEIIRPRYRPDGSSGVGESERLVLRLPIERKSRGFLKKSFRGQFRRLDALDDLLDDVGSQKCEANYLAHMTFADLLSLADFDH